MLRDAGHFERLARELGVAHAPFVVDRRIVRSALARVYTALRERTGAELAQAARDGWRGLIGTELAPLEPDGS